MQASVRRASEKGGSGGFSKTTCLFVWLFPMAIYPSIRSSGEPAWRSLCGEAWDPAIYRERLPSPISDCEVRGELLALQYVS